jgi:hypothetical protein
MQEGLSQLLLIRMVTATPPAAALTVVARRKMMIAVLMITPAPMRTSVPAAPRMILLMNLLMSVANCSCFQCNVSLPRAPFFVPDSTVLLSLIRASFIKGGCQWTQSSQSRLPLSQTGAHASSWLLAALLPHLIFVLSHPSISFDDRSTDLPICLTSSFFINSSSSH